MDDSAGKMATVYVMVQTAFREWHAAEEKALEIGRLILAAASRDELEKLSQLFEDAQHSCAGARSRFVAATHAYSDWLLPVS
jgi:hypothetical protein